MPFLANPTFVEMLSRLRYNNSRTSLVRNPGILQMRKISDEIKIGVTYNAYSFGPTYTKYPKWNTDDLQGWWAMGGPTANSVTAHPEVGGLGTFVGAPAQAEEFDTNAFTYGRNREYTTFTPTGDYLNLGDITAFDGAANVSWGFRFRLTNLAHANALFGRWPSTAANRQFLAIIQTDGDINFFIPNGTTSTDGITTDTPIAINTWYNVVVVFAGGGAANINRLKIYINNNTEKTLTFTSTIPTTLNATADDVYIGRQENATSADIEGDGYDFTWWDKALTTAEVLEFMSDEINDRYTADLSFLP